MAATLGCRFFFANTNLRKLPCSYSLQRFLYQCLSDKAADKHVQEVQGFLKAQDKLASVILADDAKKKEDKKLKNFPELMYESRMTEAGDLSETYAFGKIVNRVEDDVYIDYGGKFECVCKVPKPKTTTKEAKESKDPYQVGQAVVVQVRDPEMTARFMGYDKDMTLLEASASLVRVHHS